MATLKNTTINDTAFLKVPTGTSVERPGTPLSGMIRFNSVEQHLEYYNGTRWQQLIYSPIVTDQLTLWLDVGNPASYPGSGAIWTDLVQGITFSSIGTQTPLETIGGATSFAFNNSGYWQSTAGHQNVDLAGDCTILMWVYNKGVTTRRTIFEKAPTVYNSYEQEIAVTWETNSAFSYYSRRFNAYDFANTAALTLNAWNLVGIRMSSGKTSTARTGFYSMNGGNWVADYTSRSNTAIVPAGPVRVGSGYAGTVIAGNIGMVMCYQKMLTNAEVLQNFNATKVRFGL